MIKDIIENNENITPNQKEIAVLKEHFPSCFNSDGSFDLVRFSEFLKDDIEITKEGYELKFLGKGYAKMLASLDTETVIVPNEEHNSKPENTNSENVYISGDNLDGLKHLLKSYSEQVKCIYIDPPYNTGQDGFVYNDKFNFTADDLVSKLSISENEANRIIDLTTKNRASHSAWLTFMLPRLLLARDLLSKDGVIFISIDDNEQSNLKLLCDEVFGEENFLTCISRATGTPTGGGFDGFVNELDYILIYSKNISKAVIGKLEMSEEDIKIYNETDEFGKKCLTRSLRRTGGEDRREDRPTMFYPILAPDGSEILPYGPTGYESRWICAKEKVKELQDNNLLVWKKINKNGEDVWHPYQKFLLENRTKTPGNIWRYIFSIEETADVLWDDIEGNKKATRDIRMLFDNKKVFETAKPIGLVDKIISIISNENDIVLDFFGGSSTTAHSVMRSNVKNKSCKKYIIVQLQEKARPNSEAENAGYNFIDELGIERIIRAAKKLKEENPNTTADLGFKHYTLQDISENTLDKLETFNPDEWITDKVIYNEFGANTILTTWLVHDGYGFNAKGDWISFDGYTAYWCDKHLYLIAPDLSESDIKAIVDKYTNEKEFNPQNIVVFGYSFNFVNLESLKTNIKVLKDLENELKINIDVRY